jgi:hypothetical protein
MNKEFIPYKEAFELKQLGFDEPCLSYYEGESFSYHLASIKGDDYIIPAPLFQQVFRWFRDKKLSDMCVCRYQGRDDGGVYYYYSITKDFGIEETRHFKEGFFTYEEAELACLKKLIEIVKGGKNENI